MSEPHPFDEAIRLEPQAEGLWRGHTHEANGNMMGPFGGATAAAAQRFGRIVNVTSMSVKMPLPRLDLSSGARAGLTAFMAGVARTVAEHNVTINNLLYDSVL